VSERYTIEDQITFGIYHYDLEAFVECGVEDRFAQQEQAVREETIEKALAELATLRAKAEAWDKVAFLYPLADGPVLCAEFDEQIERIKNLTPPARGEGTEQ